MGIDKFEIPPVVGDHDSSTSDSLTTEEGGVVETVCSFGRDGFFGAVNLMVAEYEDPSVRSSGYVLAIVILDLGG